MSKAYELREAIKASIVAADIGLAADDVVIKRQADVLSIIEQNVSLATNGVMLLIGAMKKKNIAPKSDKPRWNCKINLSLWTLPIYHEGNMPEEDIGEAIENHMSQLELNPGSPNSMHEAFIVTDSDDLPDNEYLLRQILVTTTLQN